MDITEKPASPSLPDPQHPPGQSAASTPPMGGPARATPRVPGGGEPPATENLARTILAAFIGGLACAVVLILVSAVCRLSGWAP